MKLSAQVGDTVHEIVIERRDAGFLVTIDGAQFEADARKLPGDSYSILMKNRSYAVSVQPGRDRLFVRPGAAQPGGGFARAPGGEGVGLRVRQGHEGLGKLSDAGHLLGAAFGG